MPTWRGISASTGASSIGRAAATTSGSIPPIAKSPACRAIGKSRREPHAPSASSLKSSDLDNGQRFAWTFHTRRSSRREEAPARILHAAAKTPPRCSRRRQSAPTSSPGKSAPTDVGGYFVTGPGNPVRGGMFIERRGQPHVLFVFQPRTPKAFASRRFRG